MEISTSQAKMTLQRITQLCQKTKRRFLKQTVETSKSSSEYQLGNSKLLEHILNNRVLDVKNKELTSFLLLIFMMR